MTCEGQNLYGQWPMGGKEVHHAGQATITTLSHTSGASKWTITLPSGVHPVTGTALGDYYDSGSEEYRVYVGADDSKLYCYQVSYSNGNYSTNQVGSYSLNGNAVGTPVLASAMDTQSSQSFNAIYVSDTSGRLHCIRQSDLSCVWRSEDLTSSGQTITAPLYNNGRVYLGRANSSTTGYLIGFNEFYEDAPTDQTPEFETSADGAIVSTPAAGFAPQGASPEIWYIYTVTSDCKLMKWLDDLDEAVAQWTDPYFPPQNSGSQTCETWVMLADDMRIYFGAYDNSSHKGRVYAVDFYGDGGGYPRSRWSSNTYERVDQALDNRLEDPTYFDIGKLIANPCSDGGTTPNLFYNNMDDAAGEGVPTVNRIKDNSTGSGDTLDDTYGEGYVVTTMNLSSDELSSTPIYTTEGVTKRLVFVTETGKLYAVNPSTGANASGWPKTTGKTIYKQDLAMDWRGAIVFGFTDGHVYAYWGP